MPQRIISLVPSQTELLYDLGLEEEVVGITKFCIHPEAWFRNKQRVGGTKNIRFDTIEALRPDLVLANKEENVKEQVEALMPLCKVHVSDVNTVEDALQMIRDVGMLTDRNTEARSLTTRIEAGFAGISDRALGKACYLIWREPYMTVGGDTFISDMMQRCGLQNAFAGFARYPQVSVEMIRQCGCDHVLLSSEPYPFKQQHIEELRSQLPGVQIHLVDGEIFSWYGSRMLHAPAYFDRMAQVLSAQ